MAVVQYDFAATQDAKWDLLTLRHLFNGARLLDFGEGSAFSFKRSHRDDFRTVLSAQNPKANFRLMLDNKPVFSSEAEPKKGNLAVLDDVAHRLQGRVVSVDHTGLCLSQETPTEVWDSLVNRLARKVALFEYPSAPEYDPAVETWLFAIPGVRTTSGYAWSRRRQPKLEIVRDSRRAGGPVLQIDVETTFPSVEAIAWAFPDSRELPGLGAFFRSVATKSRFPGIDRIRLDLRPLEGVTAWTSGAWVATEGRRITPSCAPS